MFRKFNIVAISILGLFVFTTGTRMHGQKPAVKQVTSNALPIAPLASVFAGDDGGAYYVTEVGKNVVWFGEHPERDYAHVFFGTRTGDTIKGKYKSVPKDKATTYGDVTVRINPNGSLVRVSETGGFPCKSFSPVAMKSVVDRLPGKKKWAGFTANTLDDLDGIFDGAVYRYYIRQLGNVVVFFTEKDFQKGQQPDAAFVFVGERQGANVKGQLIAVPKGKKTGSGPLSLTLNPDRSLVRQASPLIGGAGPLVPVLPDIEVPIKSVMELLNTQLNKIKIHLDGHENSLHGIDNGSFVQFGDSITRFTIKPQDRGVYRYFINNMDSDVVHVKPVSANEGRLTVLFESGGKEIKRIDRNLGKLGDKVARDWEIENPRCDIYFKLVNLNTAGGQPSISYLVTRVSLLGEVDAPGLVEGIDDYITKLVRPIVESTVKNKLNEEAIRRQVAAEVRERFDGLVKSADEYRLFGYSISPIVPRQVLISGDNLVFRFR